MTTTISQLHLADLAGSERVDVGPGVLLFLLFVFLLFFCFFIFLLIFLIILLILCYSKLNFAHKKYPQNQNYVFQKLKRLILRSLHLVALYMLFLLGYLFFFTLCFPSLSYIHYTFRGSTYPSEILNLQGFSKTGMLYISVQARMIAKYFLYQSRWK
jgi:hypothetical protein